MTDIRITKVIGFTPENLELAIGLNRSVIVKLKGASVDLGLAPGVGLMMELTPTEARRLAAALVRTADKAEDGLPRA